MQAETFSAIHLGQLHFSRSAYRSLDKSGVRTAADLFDAPIQSKSAAIKEAIDRCRTSLLKSIDGENGIDWFVFCQSMNVNVLPSGLGANAHLADLFESLPNLIKGVVCQQWDDKSWLVIQRRYALDGTGRLTLDDLGAAFNISRERVRQIEDRVVDFLADILVKQNYSSRAFRVHPLLLSAIQSINDMMQAKVVVNEDTLCQHIFAALQAEITISAPYLALLLSLCGSHRIEFETRAIAPVWVYVGPDAKPRDVAAKQDVIRKHIERLHDLLTRETVEPLSELDILARINKANKGAKLANAALTRERLRELSESCSSIELYGDGLLRGRFEYLQGRGNQVERLLRECNATMSIRNIAREINHRLVPRGQKKLDPRNLQNQMLSDGRFVPIGRSGHWGLRSEGTANRTIIQLMEESLIQHNGPLSAEEIYSYVSSRRPVKKNSIVMYLQKRPFCRVSSSQWSLESWNRSTKPSSWGTSQVADFVVNLFKKRKVQRLEYRIVKESLADALAVSHQSAQGFLNQNPVLKTERKDGKLYAVLQENHRELLAGKRPHSRRRITLRSYIEHEAHALLDAAPGKELTLSALIAELGKKHDVSKPTLYSYVSALKNVDRIVVPGSSIKLCRLKNETQTFTFPQVQLIGNRDIQDNIKRALSHLNETDVDLALFALGKEFETTIKTYLKVAINTGAINTSKLQHDPNRWKLIDMVACAKEQGHITDDTVLQILRADRNERAHGKTPPLEERRILLASAKFIVDRYIDYIKLFDDLERGLA